MRFLGIYFGNKIISVAESEERKLLNNVQILQQKISAPETEAKVPDEKKWALAIKDELRKNSILIKDANIILMGKDLIIRTFNLPLLAANELYNAVKFEAKKYIPFKIEEIVFDFQIQIDRLSRKTFVLFVGIKKENLQKYLTVLNELSIKANSIEYSGFSLLRLLKLAKIKEKGISAVVNVDLAEEDEVNFIVLENGFPLFSRDIILTAESPLSPAKEAKSSIAESLEKLKVELRISLDFYLRKFPTKNIKDVVFIAADEYRRDLEAFVKERGLTAQFIEVKKLIERPVPYSLSFFKAYSGILAKAVKTTLKIDLLPTRARAKLQGEDLLGAGALSLLAGLKLNSRIVLIGICIIALPYMLDWYRRKPVEGQLAQIRDTRPKIAAISPEASQDELRNLAADYSNKIRNINSAIKMRPFFTEIIDAIPRILPQGVWLKDLTFSKDKANELVLTLDGNAYLQDNNKENKAVNKFLTDLKNNPRISANFKNISILSTNQAQYQDISYTHFIIVCRSR